MARTRIASLLLLLTALVSNVLAHQTSDSYLALSVVSNRLEGRWAIALRDLDHVLTLDLDKDGELSEAELAVARPKIEEYSYNRLKIVVDSQRVQPQRLGFETEEHSDAVYATLIFELRPPWIGPDILIEYTLFTDTDPLHRGLFRFDLPDRTETAIFSPAQPAQRFLIATPQKTNQLLNFIREGVWHIWTGFDHLLFLIALLLPSALHREGANWRPAPNARAAVLNVVKIVTAFTIAHSITLTIASLGWLQLPSRLVESIIAASVVVAALNNLKAIFPERVWMIAFAFGLIHGFGFASALTGLHLTSGSLALTLFGFNLGVELGQLAIVLVFVPFAFSVRARPFYQQVMLRYGSLAIVVLASGWFFERALDQKVFPF